MVAIERGTADAVGEMRKTTAVLTDDSLLLATIGARRKTILTGRAAAGHPFASRRWKSTSSRSAFDDYADARARVIQLNLKKYGDREGIIAKIRP